LPPVGSEHAGAELVADLETCLVAVQVKLTLELDGRHSWRMVETRYAVQNQIDSGFEF
jgi:hypothetical protein